MIDTALDFNNFKNTSMIDGVRKQYNCSTHQSAGIWYVTNATIVHHHDSHVISISMFLYDEYDFNSL